MKKRILLQRLATIAQANHVEWARLRDRGSHEVWAMNGRRIPIPRHREITEGTALAIIRDAERAARSGDEHG